MGLAYDGRYTSNTGGRLRPHSPTAYCNSDGPLKVAPRCPGAIPAPFISLPCAPGLYGVSLLDGLVRVGAVSLSAHLPKGGVHDPGVRELGRGVSQVNNEPGRWWAVIFTRCQACAHWEADAWASGLLFE